jgi:outer membrane lipoprotein-sorting protein
MSAEQVITHVLAQQTGVRSFQVRVVGTADFAGSRHRVDLKISAIPGQQLARVVFDAPSALADNLMIVSGQTAYTYLYLTNQVTVQPLAKTQLGGFGFNFTQVAQLASGTSLHQFLHSATLLSSQASGRSVLYQLGIPVAAGQRLELWVSSATWRPVSLQVAVKGGVAAQLRFESWKINPQLSAAALKALPAGAQVVHQP